MNSAVNVEYLRAVYYAPVCLVYIDDLAVELNKTDIGITPHDNLWVGVYLKVWDNTFI